MTAENFNLLVLGLVNNLKPYSISLTKNKDEAEDLLQETMYRAFNNQDKFKEGTNLKAWLFTIMRNIFINKYRKKSKRKTIVDTTENLYYINSSQATIRNRAESNFVMKDVVNAIQRLNSDYKVPFVMHFKGFKYQEIAEELALPLGTVKSRIFFARKALKKELSVYEELK
ncbi:MAG: RNA polymerase sigma factor [Chitinophagales bacterium]